ncbi:MAG: metal ABC transporter permease [Planctomycetota bacterium]
MIEGWTLAIAAVTAVACALSGSFLVLKREALVSEGLAHAVLPGIVIAFVVTRDRTSPLLIVGAAAMGLLMILLVQLIRRTKVVDDTASLGVVFPALFSLGILLASAELGNTHFHAECIIDGDLALAPLDRVELGGVDVGPKAFWAVTSVLVLLVGFLALLFKEMALLSFDEELASSLGLRPALLHVGWLALVSLTTVAAFEAAGSILVVALMIAPATAAVLWTDDVRRLLALACGFGLVSACAGYAIAFGLDVAPNGPMATSAGALFLVSFVVAPGGLLARRRRVAVARRAMESDLVLARLAGARSRSRDEVASELGWSQRRLDAALERAVARGAVRVEDGRLRASGGNE